MVYDKKAYADQYHAEKCMITIAQARELLKDFQCKYKFGELIFAPSSHFDAYYYWGENEQLVCLSQESHPVSGINFFFTPKDEFKKYWQPMGVNKDYPNYFDRHRSDNYKETLFEGVQPIAPEPIPVSYYLDQLRPFPELKPQDND